MLKIKPLYEDSRIPKRANTEAAGIDLYAHESVDIPAGKSALIPIGCAMSLPLGYVGLIWPRSKLAAKMGLQSGAGVVDSDYRGEVHVLLFNHSDKTQEIRKADRIAQMLIQRVSLGVIEVTEELDETARGSAGITSTEMRLQ